MGNLLKGVVYNSEHITPNKVNTYSFLVELQTFEYVDERYSPP